MSALEVMNPLARVILEKFMSWDRTEECWELHVPFPKHVVVDPKLHDLEITPLEVFEAMLEVGEVIDQTEGLTYNTIGVCNETGEISLVGLAWE